MSTGPAYIPTVLEFWFGSADPAAPVPARTEMWFRGGADLDAEIADRFGATLDALAAGQGESWLKAPGGRLAYVVVLDQFSRNVYRGSPHAFHQDARALRATLEGLELGVDRHYGLHQRAFFYLPLEHSEDPAMQERSIECYASLAEVARTDDERRAAESYLRYAEEHRRIIERFGRYPHRNMVLGRTTTSEEWSYLRRPGAGF